MGLGIVVELQDMLRPMFRAPLFLAVASVVALADTPYEKPPKAVEEILNAPLTPQISVSPAKDYAILMRGVRNPPISEVAQPMLRLAGIRIDTNTNGLHLAPNFVSYELKRLSDAATIPVKLPPSAKCSAPSWSPDGKQFAFTNTTGNGIELWVANTATGQTKQISGVKINGVRGGGGGGARGGGGGGAIEWLGDNRTMVVHMIPAGRGAAPAEVSIPTGPHVQQSLGHAGPAPTYEDLLKNPHDEDLFDYYATAQLALVDSGSGKVTPVGKPAVFEQAQISPDDQHFLIARLHRPYSYVLPMASFPTDVEVWDRKGNKEFQLASLPLAERVPIEGVRTGPRSYSWQPTGELPLPMWKPWMAEIRKNRCRTVTAS